MTEAKFKGIVQLESKEQFEQLKTNGSIIINDKTIIYSPNDTQYVIPDTTEQDIQNLQNNKVDKVEGKGLSTNDYTTEEKNKLASLENYDDSQIREELEVVKQGTVTEEEKQTWNNKLDSESDPTVPEWAKEPTKPIYDYSEIQNKPTIPTKTSELENDSNFLSGDSSQFVDLSSEQEIPGKKIFENAQGSFEMNNYTTPFVVNNSTSTWVRPLLFKDGYLYCYQYNCILKIKLSDSSVTKIEENIVRNSNDLDQIFVVNNKIISPAKNDNATRYGSILIYDTNTDTYEKILIKDGYSISSLAVIDNIVYLSFPGESNNSGVWYKYMILENKIEGPFNLSLLQDCNIFLVGFIKSSDGVYGIVHGTGTSNIVNQSTYYIGKLNEMNNTFENFVLTTLHYFSNLLYMEHEQKIYMSSNYINGYYDIITKSWNDISATIPGVGSSEFNQYIKIQGNNLYLLDHGTRIVKFDFNSTSYSVEETLPYTNTLFILDSTDTSAYGTNYSKVYFYKKISYSNFVTLDQLNSILEGYTKKS